jgi:type IV pilus assembly protein PilM
MAEHTSIWKKELRLRKSRGDAAPKAPVAASAPKKPSIWKREIRLGRGAAPALDPVRPAEPSPQVLEAPPHEQSAGETAEPVGSTSMFKLAPDREGVPLPASQTNVEERRRETPWPATPWSLEPDELDPAGVENAPELEDTLVMGPVERVAKWTQDSEEIGGLTSDLVVDAEPPAAVAPTGGPPSPAPPESPSVFEQAAGEAVAEAAAEPEPVAAAPKQNQSVFKRELHFPRPRRREPVAKGRKPVAKAKAKRTGSSTAKNLVGLRVGSSQLAAACVHNNGSAELVQLARTPLPHGIVSSGEVRDPEALTQALKAFFAEHKLPRRGVRLGIASNRIGVRVLDVPALDDPKLFENAIRFHAQETLPIAVTEAVIDYVVLGQGEGQGLEPTVRVLLVFAHRELVDRHVEACRRAGLKLEGIDFEAFALLRALTATRPESVAPEQAVVAVAVGNERTIFAVSDGRICDFTRVLEWGGGSLDVAIARALDLTPSQAEPIKLALALEGDVAPSQLSPVQIEAARAAIRTELQALARELVASLQFYQSRPDSLEIGEILLSGGGAQLSGFAAELERLVGAPVKLGDPFAHVQLGKKVSRPADPGSVTVAIGLGIEY